MGAGVRITSAVEGAEDSGAGAAWEHPIKSKQQISMIMVVLMDIPPYFDMKSIADEDITVNNSLLRFCEIFFRKNLN